LTALLDQHGERMPKSRLLMDRALVAAKSTDSASRAESWRAAMEDAKFSKAPDSYLALYDFARKAGMGDEAEQALTEAILRGRGPLPLYADIKPLLGSLSEKGRENVLMQICAIYLLFEPGNPMLLTHYAYLACLNDLAEPATILQAAEPLAKAFPDALPIQCLLAVTHLSAGKPAEAATALDSMKVDLQQIPPGFRAVILVTRALNGKIANDDPLIQQLPWQKMLPSERKKFSQWLNEIAHAPVSDSSVDSSPQQPIR
jgi:predicted Zn-dependent protease